MSYTCGVVFNKEIDLKAVLFNEDGLKPCSVCGLLKDRHSYFKASKAKSGYQSRCKDCFREFMKQNADSYKQKKQDYYLRNKEKVSADYKEYRRKNAEKCKQADRDKYARNRDAVKKRVSEYQKNYPEVNRKASKKYRDATPEKQAAKAARRRAVLLKAIPSWSDEFDKFFIQEIYDLAAKRTELLGIDFAVDHIVPLNSEIVCGLHCGSNLQILSASENSRKSNRYWPDMP